MKIIGSDKEQLVAQGNTINVDEHEDEGSRTAPGVCDQTTDVILCWDVRSRNAEVNALGLGVVRKSDIGVVELRGGIEHEGGHLDELIFRPRADEI